MNLLSLLLLASDLASGWLFVAGLSDWGRLLFNFAFFLAAVVVMVTLSGKHLADLRLSQVVLFFVVTSRWTSSGIKSKRIETIPASPKS